MKSFDVRFMCVRLVTMFSLTFTSLLMQTAAPASAIVGYVPPIYDRTYDSGCKPGLGTFLQKDLQYDFKPTDLVKDLPAPDTSYARRHADACAPYWRVEVGNLAGRKVKIFPTWWDKNTWPRTSEDCLNSYLNYYVWAEQGAIYTPIGGNTLYGTWVNNRCEFRADNPSTPGVETGDAAVVYTNPGFYYEVKAEAIKTVGCNTAPRCPHRVNVRVVALPAASGSSAVGDLVTADVDASAFDAAPLDDVNTSPDATQ